MADQGKVPQTAGLQVPEGDPAQLVYSTGKLGQVCKGNSVEGTCKSGQVLLVRLFRSVNFY